MMKKVTKVDILSGSLPPNPRVGVIGVGHHTYWDQFPGLLDEMYRKQEAFIGKLPDFVEVIDFGLIDDAEKAYMAVNHIERNSPDLLFCDMVTYATSGTIGVFLKRLNIPVVLVALQPLMAMDYTKASTMMQLMNDDICSLPEFTGAAGRLGKKIPHTIIGTLHNDHEADNQIEVYCRIAKVLHGLKHARFGHIGHSMNSMLDMNFDPTMITTWFGSHIQHFEAHHLTAYYERVTHDQLETAKAKILGFFDTPDPVSDPISMKLRDEDLNTSARIYVALGNFIRENRISGLAYYYEGAADSIEQTVMSNLAVGNSLLAAENIPVCGESDMKTLIALYIMDRFGMGGSFAEFHPVDFNNNFVLVGHDGPHNISIAEGRPVLRSLKKYHGKPGSGAGVEFKIKTGPITILSINSTFDGKFRFIISEGESCEGPIPPTGNTNTRGYFGADIRSFLSKWVNEAPTHHFALGTGHHASSIAKIAEYLGIEAVIV